jgi:hypothetical protein
MKKTLKSIEFAVFISVPVLALAQPDTLQTPYAQHKAKSIGAGIAEDLPINATQTNATEQLALERFQSLKMENSTDDTRLKL